MGTRDVGGRFDSKVSSVAEGMLRRISRRDALRTGVLGSAGALAALAVGAKPAFAYTCDCGPTYRCSHYGHSCPANGCPSGYSLCSNGSCYNQQNYRCEWSSGYWTTCNGICGQYGYKICYDCVGPGGCYDWCTCLSTDEFCCQCHTPEDVYAEMARIKALAGAPA